MKCTYCIQKATKYMSDRDLALCNFHLKELGKGEHMQRFKVQVVDRGDSNMSNGDMFDVEIDVNNAVHMTLKNPKVIGTINEGNIEQFKELYAKAKEDGKGVFVFLNQQIFTDYARYLLEYIEIIKGGYGKSKQ